MRAGASGRALAGLLVLVVLPLLVGLPADESGAATLPSGFQEQVVLSGLNQPVSVRFSPDGRVFVAERSGLIKVFDSLADPQPSVYADLRTNVHSYDDRGLLGMALDPSFPTVQDIYVAYSHDAPIGGVAPRWGTVGADSDPCPTPPGPSLDGCVVSGRLSRLRPTQSAPTSYRDTVVADGPAAYWRLGEATGTAAADASGNGRAGAYLGSPALGQAGALGSDANTSVGFDGIGQHVSVPHASALNTQSFTVEAWAYVTGGQGTSRAVVSSRDYVVGSTRGYALYAAADNLWQFWVGTGTSSWARVYGPPLAVGAWTHLVGTFDGTTARLYVNGTLAASASATLAANTARPLRIAAGANERAPDYLFPGRIDEVAVYPTALTASRIGAHHVAATGTSTPQVVETVVIEDWCQQYTSGSVGQIEFGSDGALYLAAGSGGSYNFADYGQEGDPPNPCGDPPGGVGVPLAPPTAEGGSLRSQDIRTLSDPTGLGGTLIRVDKMTGAGLPDNPFSSSSDPNVRRIVAFGFRNPFRLAIRPGTRDVWIGDVGAGNYEEIDRVPDATDSTVENFGWPCYEGPIRTPGMDAADLNLCESLYAQAGSVTPAYYAYQHFAPVANGETCPSNQGSAISGLAFAPADGGAYPAEYGGALFFADYARTCIWVMLKGANGLPDPATRRTFVDGAMYPVDLQFGPEKKLYYADIAAGTIRRIDYFAQNQPPAAVAQATPTSGQAPLTVSFDGSGSSDGDGTIIAYAWDLDGDGQFDDSTAQKPTRQYRQDGSYVVRLRVTDDDGLSDTSDPLAITVGSTPPTAAIDTPAAGFTWRAGETISFSGHGSDAEDGTIPASRMTWEAILRHCTTPTNCHNHPLQSFPGVASGSFSAPDHEYPSYIELRLTVTDSSGLTHTATRDLDPKTAALSFATQPAGLALVVNGASRSTPFTYTAVLGSTVTLSAPSPASLNGTTYAFSSWSDGGSQTHNVTAAAPTTYTAVYQAQAGSTYRAAVLADSPAGYWRLGEGAGTVAADASGAGRHGTYLGSPALGQAGALSGDADAAAGFSAVSQLVEAPFAAALNAAQFSVEAWVYPSGGTGTYRAVVSSRDFAAGTTRGYVLYAAGDNLWQFWLGTGSGAWTRVYGPSVQANTWTHLVATYDGTTARLYVNGSLAGSATGTLAPNAARVLRIAAGANERTPEYPFPGRIDEVAVYQTALTATRIQAHHTAASTP